MIDELAQALADRFRGREDVYALQLPTGGFTPQVGEWGVEIARGHVQGTHTVGLYTTRKDLHTCQFGVIDFDDTGYSGREAMKQAVLVASRVLTHMRLSHLLESSGRKGYHLWVFFSTPIEASLVRLFLYAVHVQTEAEMEVSCPVEIFPKQDQLQEGGFGNLVKLPWGVHRGTPDRRRALITDDALEPIATLEGQLDRLLQCEPLTIADVEGFLEEYPPPQTGVKFRKVSFNGERSSVFGKGAVPCTKGMFSTPVSKGGRNQRIYDLTVRQYREGIHEDQAVKRLVKFNTSLVNPPLDLAADRVDIEQEVRRIYKRGYGDLRCEKMGQFCKGEECAIYRDQHGIAPKAITETFSTETPSVTLTDLVKVDSDPPIWKFAVNGTPVQMVGAELLKFSRFKDVAFQTLNEIVRIPCKEKEPLQFAWESYLAPLMRTLTIEEAPEEASEQGRLRTVILDWADETPEEPIKPEVFAEIRRPCRLTTYPNFYAFRLETFRQFLDRRRIGSFTSTQVWDALRSLGGKSVKVWAGTTNIRVCLLPLPAEDEGKNDG